MRLLVDENIDKLAVVKLRADGHDVFYALEDTHLPWIPACYIKPREKGARCSLSTVALMNW